MSRDICCLFIFFLHDMHKQTPVSCPVCSSNQFHAQPGSPSTTSGARTSPVGRPVLPVPDRSTYCQLLGGGSLGGGLYSPTSPTVRTESKRNVYVCNRIGLFSHGGAAVVLSGSLEGFSPNKSDRCGSIGIVHKTYASVPRRALEAWVGPSSSPLHPR